jgi:hypothetical protein
MNFLSIFSVCPITYFPRRHVSQSNHIPSSPSCQYIQSHAFLTVMSVNPITRFPGHHFSLCDHLLSTTSIQSIQSHAFLDIISIYVITCFPRHEFSQSNHMLSSTSFQSMWSLACPWPIKLLAGSGLIGQAARVPPGRWTWWWTSSTTSQRRWDLKEGDASEHILTLMSGHKNSLLTWNNARPCIKYCSFITCRWVGCEAEWWLQLGH